MFKNLFSRNKRPEPQYTCPSCGFIVFTAEMSYEICGICWWEDDPVQAKYPDLTGSANTESLRESQVAALVAQPVEVKQAKDRRGRKRMRDPQWRPLRSDEGISNEPESNADYFHAACNAEPTYYWLS